MIIQGVYVIERYGNRAAIAQIIEKMKRTLGVSDVDVDFFSAPGDSNDVSVRETNVMHAHIRALEKASKYHPTGAVLVIEDHVQIRANFLRLPSPPDGWAIACLGGIPVGQPRQLADVASCLRKLGICFPYCPDGDSFAGTVRSLLSQKSDDWIGIVLCREGPRWLAEAKEAIALAAGADRVNKFKVVQCDLRDEVHGINTIFESDKTVPTWYVTVVAPGVLFGSGYVQAIMDEFDKDEAYFVYHGYTTLDPKIKGRAQPIEEGARYLDNLYVGRHFAFRRDLFSRVGGFRQSETPFHWRDLIVRMQAWTHLACIPSALLIDTTLDEGGEWGWLPGESGRQNERASYLARRRSEKGIWSMDRTTSPSCYVASPSVRDYLIAVGKAAQVGSRASDWWLSPSLMQLHAYCVTPQVGVDVGGPYDDAISPIAGRRRHVTKANAPTPAELQEWKETKDLPEIVFVTPTMPERETRMLKPLAAESFNHCGYPKKKMTWWIVMDEEDSSLGEDLTRSLDMRVNTIPASGMATGGKRNIGISCIRGVPSDTVVFMLDDDCLFTGNRIFESLWLLDKHPEHLCVGWSRVPMYIPDGDRIDWCSARLIPTGEVAPYEETMAFRLSMWESGKFPTKAVAGEGAGFIRRREDKILVVNVDRAPCVSLYHGGNITKRTTITELVNADDVVPGWARAHLQSFSPPKAEGEKGQQDEHSGSGKAKADAE